MLIIGEVHTGLVRNRAELSDVQCLETLSLTYGERPRISLSTR